MSHADVEPTDIEIRIALSQSSPNKLWVTLIDNGEEFAVGFNKEDMTEILQVNESFFEDLEDEELEDPRLAEAQAALCLACCHPKQFVLEPENQEAIAYLEAQPTEYIAPKHIQRVLNECPDCTGWVFYEMIEPKPAKGKASLAKPTKSKPAALIKPSTSAQPSQFGQRAPRRIYDEEPVEEYEDSDVSDDEAQYDSESYESSE